MKTYAVHTKLVETQDLIDMLALFKHEVAEYDDFYLFGQVPEDPQQPIVDMRPIEDLDEFDVAYLQLLTEEHTGRWVYLSKAQGRFLKSKYFNEVEDEPI